MHNNDDTPTQECALTLPSPPAGETARARGPSLADVCGELPRGDMASGFAGYSRKKRRVVFSESAAFEYAMMDRRIRTLYLGR